MKENNKQYQAPITEVMVCHVECGFSLSGITEPEQPRNTEAMNYGTPMSI